MFKSETVRRLEETIRQKDMTIERLKDEIRVAEMRVDEMDAAKSRIPDDCTPGGWCSACKFARGFHRYNHVMGDFETVYLCQKDKSCKHFLQREVKKNDQA